MAVFFESKKTSFDIRILQFLLPNVKAKAGAPTAIPEFGTTVRRASLLSRRLGFFQLLQ